MSIHAPRGERGVVLAGVIVLMLIMSIIVPAMVLWVQNEARWTVKQDRSIKAFQLAEGGVDRAFNKVTESTMTWASLQAGGSMGVSGIPTSYIFNMTFTDLSSGTYTIAVSSGPDAQQVTIYSVGRDFDKKEVRAIKAVYQNAPLGDIAIMGGNGVSVTGNNMQVDWGAVISPKDINTGGKLHPQFWSAGAIDLDTNGSAPPNCDSPDCKFWHSYYSGIPPVPELDFDAYKALAQAAGTGPCGVYYETGSKDLSCTDATGKTYYIEGNVTNLSGHIVGNVICIGDLATANGNLGGAAYTATLPREAWKQYGNDWAYYTAAAWDPTAPGSFPGLTSSYKSPAGQTVGLTPVLAGFMYVGGNFQGPTGGGNSQFVYGVIYVKGTVTLNSNSFLKNYYSASAASAVLSTKIYLTRVSWENVVLQWPSTAN